MKKTTAYKMIETLGASIKKAMTERGVKYEDMGDLIAGLGGFKVMMMTDADIPNIEKAYEIVAADVGKYCYEAVVKEKAKLG